MGIGFQVPSAPLGFYRSSITSNKPASTSVVGFIEAMLEAGRLTLSRRHALRQSP
jgi:hypothetical protein